MSKIVIFEGPETRPDLYRFETQLMLADELLSFSLLGLLGPKQLQNHQG